MIDISEIFHSLLTRKYFYSSKFMVPIIVDCQIFSRFIGMNYCGFTSTHFIYDQEIIMIKIQFVSRIICFGIDCFGQNNFKFVK